MTNDEHDDDWLNWSSNDPSIGAPDFRVLESSALRGIFRFDAPLIRHTRVQRA